MPTQELIYGRSPYFREMVALIDGYAASPWPVLIQGETGVGKELVARRVHQRSARPTGPFMAVNCGAMPPALFESELFGHEKGAFSGASHRQRGLLQAAHGGTLFLDEIGDLDRSLQVKLLRFLDSGELRPVGSVETSRADVRLVAATNVRLPQAVRDGRFRHDLYERLSVLTVHVPPLRERCDDIALIARDFLRQLGVEVVSETLSPLGSFPWPGNVRQLRNLLVRAVTRSSGELTRELLEALLREEAAVLEELLEKDPRFARGSLAEIEKQVIVARLNACHGNRTKTAEGLGIAKSTLQEKLRRWNLSADEAEETEGMQTGMGTPCSFPAFTRLVASGGNAVGACREH